MGDLTFGEPLGLLENSDYIPWVTMIFAALKFLTIMRVLRHIPGLSTITSITSALIPGDLGKKRLAFFAFASERVKNRLESNTTRPDIWTLVLKNAEKGNALTRKEMDSNASLFMGAGSETTATELSGLLYYLTTNPDKMKKLVAEIRGEFKDESEIVMDKLAGLRYLNACIEEGLRIYMPVPIGLPRKVPKEGAEICGQWVAPGVSHHSCNSTRHPECCKATLNYQNSYLHIFNRLLSPSASTPHITPSQISATQNPLCQNAGLVPPSMPMMIVMLFSLSVLGHGTVSARSTLKTLSGSKPD
jgi:hypothetical protein